MSKSALLAHQAQHPGFLQLLRARIVAQRLAIRREIAHAEIVQLQSLVGGVDGAVEHFVLAREFGRGQELPVVHAAYGPDPFTRRFETLIQLIQRERAP
jgi:hypothetical protein